MLGIGHTVYETPTQNMCAAHAAADELKHLEGDELHDQMEHLQELINTANTQQDMGNRMLGAS